MSFGPITAPAENTTEHGFNGYTGSWIGFNGVYWCVMDSIGGM